MVDQPKVTVYSTPTCPYCVQVKSYLKDKGVEFSDKDVAADIAARNEMVKKTGQLGVPVISVGDEVVVGFNRGKLDQLLPGS